MKWRLCQLCRIFAFCVLTTVKNCKCAGFYWKRNPFPLSQMTHSLRLKCRCHKPSIVIEHISCSSVKIKCKISLPHQGPTETWLTAVTGQYILLLLPGNLLPVANCYHSWWFLYHTGYTDYTVCFFSHFLMLSTELQNIEYNFRMLCHSLPNTATLWRSGNLLVLPRVQTFSQWF